MLMLLPLLPTWTTRLIQLTKDVSSEWITTNESNLSSSDDIKYFRCLRFHLSQLIGKSSSLARCECKVASLSLSHTLLSLPAGRELRENHWTNGVGMIILQEISWFSIRDKWLNKKNKKKKTGKCQGHTAALSKWLKQLQCALLSRRQGKISFTLSLSSFFVLCTASCFFLAIHRTRSRTCVTLSNWFFFVHKVYNTLARTIKYKARGKNLRTRHTPKISFLPNCHTFIFMNWIVVNCLLLPLLKELILFYGWQLSIDATCPAWDGDETRRDDWIPWLQAPRHSWCYNGAVTW